MNKINAVVGRGLFGALMLVGCETAAFAVDGCNTIRDPIVGVWNGESLASGNPAQPGMAVLHAGGTGVYHDTTGVGGVVWKRTGVHTYQFSSTSIAEAPATVATAAPAAEDSSADVTPAPEASVNSSTPNAKVSSNGPKPAAQVAVAEPTNAVPSKPLVRIYTAGTAVTNSNCKALTIKGTVAYYPVGDVNFTKPIDGTNTPVTFSFTRGR